MQLLLLNWRYKLRKSKEGRPFRRQMFIAEFVGVNTDLPVAYSL